MNPDCLLHTIECNHIASGPRSISQRISIPENTEEARNLVRAHALCDLHLFLSGYSPLTCGPQEWSPDIEAILDDLLSPSYNNRGSHEFPEEIDILRTNTSKRVQRLIELYECLPWPHPIAAKVVYSISLHLLCEEEDYASAERTLVECVFLLEQCSLQITPDISSATCLLPLITDLGAGTLLLYADVLLNVSKYVYAMAAFDGAIMTLRSVYLVNEDGGSVRNTEETIHSLYRRLAMICTEKNDTLRAVALYRKIIAKCKEERNVNEVRKVFIFCIIYIYIFFGG